MAHDHLEYYFRDFNCFELSSRKKGLRAITRNDQTAIKASD